MIDSSAILWAGICFLLLLTSAIWAEFRFQRFTRLPSHFDFAGRATRLASRHFVIWLTPAIFITLMGLIVILAYAAPPEFQSGDPNEAIKISGVIVLGAQVLVLWLLSRWARNQS